LSARQWRDQISVDSSRCPPAAKYFYILERRRPSGQLVSWRAWSASAVTIRTGKNREHDDEPAKSNNGRTGADPEEANQTTPPSGSLQALFTPKLSINFYALSAQLIFLIYDVFQRLFHVYCVVPSGEIL
ncbi:hypothetical protein T05_9632, partial [Trichinella murrelli]